MADLIIAALENGSGRRNDPDLLTRWIAHQLAEVIATVEKARSARARNEALLTATELVCCLWRHRTSWPDGWPPEPARRRLAQLETPRASWLPAEPRTGSAWIDRIAELEELSRAEKRLWWQIGLLETGVEDQRDALARLPDDADELDDLVWLRSEIRLHDDAFAWVREEKLRSRKAVRERAAAELAKLAERRAALVAEVVASRGPAHRKRNKA